MIRKKGEIGMIDRDADSWIMLFLIVLFALSCLAVAVFS